MPFPSSAAEVCGADAGRYNAGAVLPQGAFDVQSIRAAQTADPRAKQAHPSGPARRSARVNSRSGDGDSPGSAFSFAGSGGEFSEASPLTTTDVPKANDSVIMIISRPASGFAPATATPNWPPGSSNQRRCGCDRDGCVVASIWCSRFGVGFVFPNPLSQKHGRISLSIHLAATRPLSVDSGLGDAPDLRRSRPCQQLGGKPLAMREAIGHRNGRRMQPNSIDAVSTDVPDLLLADTQWLGHTKLSRGPVIVLAIIPHPGERFVP